jgi:hypothetical protein
MAGENEMIEGSELITETIEKLPSNCFKGRKREEIMQQSSVSACRVPFFAWIFKGQ